MRPTIKFLKKDLITKIISEAYDILNNIGIKIHNKDVLKLLSDKGALVDPDKHNALIPDNIIDEALKSAPSSFKLYNTNGEETHHFIDYNTYFTPGSAAINILDGDTEEIRKPNTSDYIKYAKLNSKLYNIASQSTAFIPADVCESISDSYRLFLSLLFCNKPVITGAFTIEGFEIMKDLLLVVRDTEEELKNKPLAVFSCCPTSPLKWSDVTSQNVVDCANYSIPVEFISMPLSGFMAPVTLTGTLIQHTAETLSGIVISQLTNPGTPVLYGGSPAIFDIRYETTPMGAIETMMIDCAYNEIGKALGLPTQAYISLSDAKLLDAQAGIESSMGATLAVLSGINNVSGPGMLDFESCFSLEKLAVDNEICGMTLRMAEGITPREDFPSLPVLQELIEEGHLLISKHTRKYINDELSFPGDIINRSNLSRWKAEGGKTLQERARIEVKRLIDEFEPTDLTEEKQKSLKKTMESASRNCGMDKLPEIEI